MTKLEVIEKAYGEVGLPLNENTSLDSGWTKIKPGQYSSKYDKVDLLKTNSKIHRIRPKSLSGIENNNGWIKIESEADLPKEIDKWKLFRMAELKLNGDFEIYGFSDATYGSTVVMHWKNKFGRTPTHYRPVVEFSKPLY